MSEYEYGQEGWGDDDDQQQDNQSNGAVEIENLFYEADSEIKENPESALEKFESVTILEESRGEINYTFKALRHIIIVVMKLGRYDTMLENQKVLLRTSTRAEVSRNELTEAINDVQDAITKHVTDPGVAREMY